MIFTVAGNTSVSVNTDATGVNSTFSKISAQSFDFEKNPDLVGLTIACAFTCVWFLFITFYHAQILGFIVTKLLSRFIVKDKGYLHIGSFSISLLSGKMMFKNVQYVTKDYSFQVVDGLAIFKWWLRYDSNDLKYYRNLKRDNKDADLQSQNCRLVFFFNGMEVHYYNRFETYKDIEDRLKCERYGDAGTSTFSNDNVNSLEEPSDSTDADATLSSWRELFPLVQMNIRSGKLAIGNRLLETTVWVHFNSGEAAYSCPDATSELDNFTHFFKCNCNDVRMLLSNSPDYEGPKTEPPSFMGEGFTVLQSAKATVTYFMDEPGVVPPDVDLSSMSDPEWGLDIKFQKNAKIWYGPWVDQQRFFIQKYFFPNDFRELPVTKPAEREELRVHSGFDVNIEFPKETTFHLLFTKNEETSAMHIVCYDTATFHYYQPWIVNEYGYSNNIMAHFQNIEISSSMTFQKLCQCETAEINLNLTMPRMWNSFQCLKCEVWLTKTTCYYINDQLDFFNDLSKDWSSKEPPDIAKFLPYEWDFHLYIRDFELILFANQFNWIDCTTTRTDDENNQLALCGETLDVSFNLAFTEFLPETVETKFFFRGETVILRSFLPISNTLRRSVISLAHSSDRQMYPKFSYVASTDTCLDAADETMEKHTTNEMSSDEQLSKGWRHRTGESDHWIDVWSVPVLVLNLYYTFHPVHFENELILNINQRCGIDYTKVEVNKLAPDVITVELEAGPSAVRIFGTFWRQFFAGIKENYFGCSEHIHEFNASKTKKDTNRTVYTTTAGPTAGVNSNNSGKAKHGQRSTNISSTTIERENSSTGRDIRQYRPLEANITLVLLEIQAELTMHTCHDLPSPHVYTDRLTFEMKKTYRETKLQLIISPISIILQDALKRASDQSHLSKGFLALSGLQFRGHAMFSDKDIPLGAPTVEYGWLMELQCAKLTGKLTPLQLQLLLLWLQTFLLHLKDEENVNENPDPVVRCPHNQNQLECTHIIKGHKVCPSEDLLKYKMFRFSVEAVDLYISEVECACNVQASPIRFSTCNSTSHEAMEGGSFFINEVSIRQFVQQLNLGLDDSPYPQYVPLHSNSWIEVGVIALGPVTADMMELGKDTLHLRNQVTFLKLHDKHTKRLWFLWNADSLKNKLAADRCRGKICGCVGGCNFFDTNINGVRFFTNQSLDAASEKNPHYGSESLWGGQTGVGSSVKELINKMSDAASTSLSNIGSNLGSNVVRRYKKNGTGSADKTLVSGTETPDVFDGSGSFVHHPQNSNGSKASKLACDRSRSRSLMGHTVSQHSLPKRTESEDIDTFYSCESEADEGKKEDNDGGQKHFRSRSHSNSAHHASKHSLKSAASSASYVSAMTEISDDEDVDGTFHAIGPLVSPGLLLAYTHYMQPVTCINWRQNIPSNFRRKFSLMKNLKLIFPLGSRSTLPSLPSFNPNVHGKLPFAIVPKNQNSEERQNKISNSTIGNSSSIKEVKEKKSVVNIKLHRKVSLILTPLLIQALDRYISCLNNKENSNHVLHTLDALHSSCIDISKKQFVENQLIGLFNAHHEESNEELRTKVNEIAPPNFMTMGLLVPEVNVIFLQISSEPYIQNEQSSISGQCGSEYSDCDLKNTDCVLMAAKFSSLSFNAHQAFQNDNLFNCCIALSQRCKSLNTPNNFPDSCEDITTCPSAVTFSGDMKGLETQVMYLEGNNDRQTDRQVHVTRIPTSSVQFHVLQGGDLSCDAVSTTDAVSNKDILRNDIIFEAGIDGISVTGVFQKKINEELMKIGRGINCNNNNNAESLTSDLATKVRLEETKQENDQVHDHIDPKDNGDQEAVDLETNSMLKEKNVENDVNTRETLDNGPVLDVVGDKRSDNDASVRVTDSKPDFSVVNVLDEDLNLSCSEEDEHAPMLKKNLEGSSRSSLPRESLTRCSREYGMSHGHDDSEESSLDNSSLDSCVHIASTRKGYIALDVDYHRGVEDTSDGDADDEHEDEDGHVSINVPPTDSSVKFKKGVGKKSTETDTETKVKVEPVVLVKLKGNLKLSTVWVNLAAPTHLRNIHYEEVHSLNLVNVLVPAISCWLTPVYDFLATVKHFFSGDITWKRSVLACFMGQGLPEQMVTKHNIPSAVSALSEFLQEEYSSQLMYVMRRQSDGHRLLSIKKSLLKASYSPKPDDLLAGIHALARPWKCMLIGAEVPENQFGVSDRGTRKPVVGRGKLTKKDLAIIKENFPQSQSLSDNPSVESPVEVIISENDQLNASPPSEHTTNHKTNPLYSATNALLSRTISEVGEEVEEEVDEVGQEVQEDIEDGKMSPQSNINFNSNGGKRESFYDWMKSQSPPASEMASPLNESLENEERDVENKNDDEVDLHEDVKDVDDLISEKLDNTVACQLDLLRSNSPMVSVPTSGTQLAKAAVVFNTIFAAVGMKSGPSKTTEISGKGALLLEKFQINLKEEEVEVDETLPAFVLDNLTINLQGSGGREQIVKCVPSMEPIDLDSNDVKFFVDVRDIHHHLDFKFVRLVLQITETMKVLTEQKKYAQKNKDSVTSDKGYADWDKVTTDMNSEIEEMPKSWRNMYQVMNLYKINIEQQQQYNSSDNISPAITSPASLLKQRTLISKVPTQENGSTGGAGEKTASRELNSSPKASATDSFIGLTLSITGTVNLKKARLTASISGLDLDFEMKNLCGTYMKDRKKDGGGDEKESGGMKCFDIMSSLSLHINKLTVCLLESIKGKKTMMECRVTRSHMLHTTMMNSLGKMTERSLLAIGPIVVEIPQHPGALRNIIAQFTARLQTHYMEFDGYRVSKGNDNDIVDLGSVEVGSRKESNSSATTSSMFRVSCKTIQLTAALLPSLSANYNIDKVNGWGSVNGKVTFFFHLPSHVLSFNTRAELSGPLPETTNISLPPIKVDGKWIEIPADRTVLNPNPAIRGHSYLPIQVNIGPLVHNLSTDLLNHLVFLQKGFAKEVNQVVQDVETNEPIPLWKKETEEELVSSQPMRYSIKLKIETIIITATTPSSTGVRLKTGEIFFELANQNPQLPVIQPHYPSSKMYGSAGLVLNLSLGQFNTRPNPGVEDQDLSVFANFYTSLSMRNAAHEDRFDTDYKETIYITLEKPQLFVMPAAVDKGVSVYLHYKNAYDQWVEQRSNLSTEYSTVAERILNRFPAAASTENISRHLFLQVFVNDLGIGLPLRETTSLPTTTLTHGLADIQPGTALLITITNTVITCCNSGSFAMSGHFKDFCIQFAEDFDHNVDNWCHDIIESSNTYKIPEGSYEVCSRSENTIRDRTTGAQLPGKWMMTVFWKMRGIDVNLDVNIGKRLSLLFNVLTAITGDSDVADLSSLAEAEDIEKESAYQDFEDDDDVVDGGEEVYDVDVFGGQDHGESFLGGWPTDNLQESKTHLQKKLSYHTRQVDKLRRSNASPEQIGKEVKSLQEVELMYKNQFLKDVRKKFRSRSTRVRPTNLNVSNYSNTTGKKSSDMKRNSLHLPAEEHVTYLPNIFDSFDMVDGQLNNSSYNPNDVTYSARRLSMEERGRPTELPSDEFQRCTSTMVKFSDSTCDVREKGNEEEDCYGDEGENVTQQYGMKAEARPTALDFELNVMADIDTGKCTFHTSEGETKEDDSYLRELDRRHRPPRTAASSVVGEDTVILIPGVNVRVHYLSTNLVEKTTGDKDDSESAESSSLHSSNLSKQQVKTADLNALILIQSLSKEMVVRPSLLDFLEQALEPIMEDVAEKKDISSPSSPDTGTGSVLSSSNSSLYSFPVNVSVLIRVDPSDLRFSCLPISKVECWLRIPSLDFAITRTQAPYITPISTSPRKRSVIGGKDSLPTTQGSSTSGDVSDISAGFSFTLCLSRFSFCIFHPYGAAQYGSTSEIRSGLQSKSIFTDQKKEPKRFSLPMLDRRNSLALNVEFVKFNLFRKTMKVPLDQVSSSSNNTQEFRTEVGVSAICDLGSASFTYDMRRLNEILDFPKAWYKRGLVQRIFLGEEGSYATQTATPQPNKSTDAPLSEASLRDGFIHPADRSHSELQLHRNSQTLKQPPRKTANLTSHRRAVSGSSHFFSSLMSPFPIPRATTVGSRKDALTQSQDPVRVRSTSDFTFSPSTTDLDSTPEPTESLTSHSQVCNQWETNVVIAFKVSRIDMSTNMGNIMGQASWNTHDLSANCNILLNNTGKRTGQFDVSVQKCKLQATGGVIGITADLEDIKSEMKFDENLGSVPNHSLGSSVKSLELRLDYMGASIIMATLHALRMTLNDEWVIPQLSNSPRSSDPSQQLGGGVKATCEILLNCDASWDEFQLIISRSTTPDIVKIISKLEDFFDQQHRNSIRALSSFRRQTNRMPDYNNGSLTSTPKTEDKSGEKKDNEDGGLKYQHWMKILNGVYGLKLKNIALPLPEKNIVLGGKLVLHGTFFSLACFHANNFRSQTWGLFQMIGPCIEFTTKNRAFEKSCQVMRGKSIQKLTISLGESADRDVSERRKSSSNMQDFKATVRQVSRGSRNPPSLGAHVQEWMSFVNTISDDDLPSYSSSPTNRQNTHNEKFSHTKVSSNIRKVSFAPKFRYENKSDVIFALPGLSLKLDTEHDMPMTSAIARELRKVEQKPTNFVMKPSNHTVDINFVSDFDDSLTVDISKVIFLHDLVLNYMKEKEASVTVSSSRTPRHKTSDASTSSLTTSPKGRDQSKPKDTNARKASSGKEKEMKKPSSMKRTDSIKKEEKYREFRTLQWKLEPTLSMYTWGSRTDPISIKSVLQNLGFMHAALTIPKWMQRGVLDPMDVVLAKLVGQVLARMVENDDDKKT